MESAASPRVPRSSAVLWIAVWTGPALWAAQGLFGWFIETQSCYGGTAWALSPGAVKTIELLVSAAALAATAWAFWVGLGNWRTSSSDSGIYGIHGRERAGYVAAVACLVSGIFALAIVWAGMSVAILPVCEGWR